MSQKINAQNEINKAVERLEKSVNNSIVDFHDVEKAFMRVHPYLLNLIAKGICNAMNNRREDGRVNIKIFSVFALSINICTLAFLILNYYHIF